MTLDKKVKQDLDKVLNKVGIQNFYFAVSHLYDVGFRNMTEEYLKHTIEVIKKQEDRNSFMTNEFQIFLLETSFEISKVAKPLEVARYISGI